MTHPPPEVFPSPADGPSVRGTVLNVGCGARGIAGTVFPAGEWREVRLDIDPGVEPDIVASITDMAPVPDAAVDAVWSSHNLEHLYAHDVPAALREAGFDPVVIWRQAELYELQVRAFRPPAPAGALERLGIGTAAAPASRGPSSA